MVCVKTKKSHSRKYGIAIDNLKFEFIFLGADSNLSIAPKEGIYITGLILEGGKWNTSDGFMVDADPMTLYSNLAPVHIKVIEKTSKPYSRHPLFTSPVYIFSSREGTMWRADGQTKNIDNSY